MDDINGSSPLANSYLFRSNNERKRMEEEAFMLANQDLPLCSFCQSPALEAPLHYGSYVICLKCSECGIACFQCKTLMEDDWQTALAQDFRFLNRDVEIGHCDACKERYYQAHREELQEAYKQWLTSHYRTPSFVYGLLDPRDRLTYYIGRTHDITARMREHRGKGSRDNAARSIWVRSLHDEGLTFEHCILAQVEPGYRVAEMEARWIAVGIQRGWPLTNKEISQASSYTLTNIRSSSVDYLTCPMYMLKVGDRLRIAQINMYSAWIQSMPKHLPNCHPFFGMRPGDDPVSRHL
ncbi:MAG: hypothetical protein ACRDIV_17815 [Ktedonobacteraceae bacterium]